MVVITSVIVVVMVVAAMEYGVSGSIQTLIKVSPQFPPLVLSFPGNSTVAYDSK